MMSVTKRCLFCGDRERIVQLYPQTFTSEDLTPEVFSARRTTEHFHYTVVRCTNCGLTFSRNILADSLLSTLYAQSTVTFGEYTDIIRRDYWRCLEPFLRGAPTGAALEIGCSNGFFLEELLDRGFHSVAGCEPSREARETAAARVKETIVTEFFRPGLFPKNSFDLVCSFQTLDHLSDPLDVVRTCYDMLKPDGLAYFITHNVDSWQRKMLGGRSPVIDVEHIYLFNKTTLRRLCEHAGFTVDAVGGVRNSYPLEYWLRMFPLPQVVKIPLQKLVHTIRLGAVSVPIRAGNIFIIARKPI